MLSSRPPAPVPADPASGAGLGTLAPRYDVLLCDLWGVMHNGRDVFAPAVAALQRFRGSGGTVIFITNAPRPRGPVLEQIAGLGLPGDAFDGIVTSGDVTVAAVAEAGDRPVFHIGPERDEALFDAVAVVAGFRPPLVPLERASTVVVSGLFDDRTETPGDYADTLAVMRTRDLPMICANPDIVVHVGEQLIYCGGALAEAYGALGGRTILAGKPHAPIYRAALAMAAETRGAPVDAARVLAIGDGLVTDGAGAARQGLDFLFITSGIHRDEFHPDPNMPLDPRHYADRLAALSHPYRAAAPFLAW